MSRWYRGCVGLRRGWSVGGRRRVGGLSGWRVDGLSDGLSRVKVGVLMEDWVPDVVELKSCVLGNCVVAVDFDGFSNSSGVPVLDVGE